MMYNIQSIGDRCCTESSAYFSLNGRFLRAFSPETGVNWVNLAVFHIKWPLFSQKQV